MLPFLLPGAAAEFNSCTRPSVKWAGFDQGHGRSYVYDMAYAGGHVYMAGFSHGNLSFHTTHVTNGPTGPSSLAEKMVVHHVAPDGNDDTDDGMAAAVYKVTDEGVPVSVFAPIILPVDADFGAYGWFKGLGSFQGDDAHIVGVGRFRGTIAFPMASGSDVQLTHAKDDYDGFAVKIDVLTNKAVWATGAGQAQAGCGVEDCRAESRDVATTAKGHVVISGDTDVGGTETGRLTLLDGATGSLVWEKSFPGAFELKGVAAAGEKAFVTGQVGGADVDPFGTGAVTSANAGADSSAFIAAFDTDHADAPVSLWSIVLPAESEGEDVTLSPDGAFVYLTGEIKGAATIGSCSLTGALEGYLIKLDAADGSCLWAKDVPTDSRVVADADYVYASGWSDDPMVYGAHTLLPNPPSPEREGGYEADSFIAKFMASDGTGIWAEGFGGSGNDFLYSAVMTPKGPAWGGRSQSDYVRFGGATINNLQHARGETAAAAERGDDSGERAMFALMLSSTDVQPACIESCTGDITSATVKPGFCLVGDNQKHCVAHGEFDEVWPCFKCDAGTSQTALQGPITDDYCYFANDGPEICHPAGHAAPHEDNAPSTCKTCDPSVSTTGYTVKEGFLAPFCGLTYHSRGAGACRGAGGAIDKVNARHKAGLTKAECEAACDAIPADGSDGVCAGYAHKASDPSECILYGPGMAGSCAAPNDATKWKEVCEAIGTCDAPSGAASENGCGSCSDGSAVKEDACASVSGTWSKGMWTQTGVWELSAAESGWTGEFHHTDHIHGITANAQYECVDKDVTDHVGKCSDGAATGCAAAFIAADTFESDSCPTGCTWTDAPVSPTPIPAHPAVADVTGYSYLSGACRSTSPANLADSSATPMQDRPAYMYAKNTEFPSFPAGLSPAELAATCDQINADHAADSLANPAQCLGFHSGPWVSLFGKSIDKAGPHLKAGWSGWDEGSGTTDLTGTKPNHQYVCFIAAETHRVAFYWKSGKPDFFPAGIPAPLSYYYLDEGMGMALAEHSGSGVDKDAGRVVVIDEHQLHASNKSAGATHQGANWQADEYFGTSIACGKIDDTILQKDTLGLKDVDYGSGGSWAWSVWFRHEKDVNFPDYQREQFFGHGNPIFPTTSNDQVHIQFEKSGSLRTILYDKKDYTRFTLDCMQEHCYPDGTGVGDPPANPHCYKEFANGTTNQAAYDCWKAGSTSASTDTDAAIRDYDNGLWHNLVLTTKAVDEGGGKGFNMYVDGVLRSASPFIDGVGKDKGYADASYLNHLGVGGDPINPDGEIRLCGRAKPAVWTDDDADKSDVWFDEKRYFRGKVAHFSLWNAALSQEQVSKLHKAYVDKFGLTVTPFEMPAHVPKPLAYYYLDEGHGFDLKESMSQDPQGGKVRYMPHHQIGKGGAAIEYDQPNWMHDDHFGRTISCGEISNKTHPGAGTQQKDFITLSDVDYGHNGQWAWSVWYKHELDMNFPEYQREQFFGHGNPIFPTSARHQVHVQFEKDDGILAIIKDGKDYDRFSFDCMKDFCPADYEELKKVPECFKWWPDNTDNPEAYACWKAGKDSASFETVPLAKTDNGMWHHLVLTTAGSGKGTNLYVDGLLEAASPYSCTSTGCVGLDKGNSGPEYLNHKGVGGDPIDPEGEMRLCGRLKGGAIWPGGDPALPGGQIDAEEAEFDPKRYFRGKVAHFSVWDAALSQHQVNALLEEYRQLYKLPAYSRPQDEPETIWKTKATLAGWTEPPKPSCNLDEHHPENGGFYVEGIAGAINSERDLETGKRADDGTWEPNKYYPHGEMKLCTGMFCSDESRVTGSPQYVSAHTCAKLRFTYAADSGSDVYELPSQEALDACDFTSAILRGDTSAGAGDDGLEILYDHDHVHKYYYYAASAGCSLGQKVVVMVVGDHEGNFAQCKGMGSGSSRIKQCDCNHQLKPTTLIDPCHTAFVYGCLADMPDDLSCCPGEGTTYDPVAGQYVAPEGGRTGTCIAKSHLAAAAEKVPEVNQMIADNDPKLAEYAEADCPAGGWYGPPKDPLCDLYKARLKCSGGEKPEECASDPNWVAFAAFASMQPQPPPSGPHFKDDTGVMSEWSAAKPKVLTGAFTAITLMHMGLDSDQIYGTFGDRTTSGSNVGGVYADGNAADHGDHAAAAYDKLNFPADPNDEERAMLAKAHDLSEDCSASNYWCTTFNMALLDQLGWPDVIVQGPYNDASVVSTEVKAEAEKRGIPIIAITSSYSTEDAPPKGFIEIAHRFAELATALGATDVDAAAWADKAALRDAVDHFKKASRRAASKGLKALAGYIPYGAADDNGDVGAFLASPDKDPVLLMLEELGMPIMHTDVAQKDSWEYMLTPGMKMSATNLMSSGSLTGGRVRVPYPVDFFLYDVRVTLDFTSDAFAAAWPHPALAAKQYAYWPSNGHIFSYRHAATILELVGEKLMVAEPLHGQKDLAKSGCVNVEVPDDHIYRTTGLAPGEVACYNPVSYTWLDDMTAPPPPHPPSPPPAEGTFTDGNGKTHTWHTSKPKIVTGAFQALTLIDMGLDPTQIIGTFGERATSGSNVDSVYANYNQASHGDHANAPYDASHFLTDPSPEEKALLANMYDASPGCSGSNNWCSEFDVAVMDANGWPDVIIAGPLFEEWVVANKAGVVAGAAARGVPIIVLQDQTTSKLWKSFIELAEDFEALAQALGADTEAATASDKAKFCTHATHFAQVASAAQERGVRSLAGVIPYGAADPVTGDIGGWLQTPDRNPALTMLEALGMQILHTETGYSGGYYESRTAAKMSATDLKSASGAADYSVDFFLYDPRTALDIVSDAFAAAWPHPAIVAKQYAPYPITTLHYSYRHAWKVLESVGSKLEAATKVDPAETTCTAVDFVEGEHYRTSGLAPGAYACVAQPIKYDWCAPFRVVELEGTVAALEKAAAEGPPEAPDDDGFSGGTVAGIAVGTLISGIIIGAIIGALAFKSSEQKYPPPRGKEMETRSVDTGGPTVSAV